MPRPPPTSSTRGVQPISERHSAANPASQSTEKRAGATSRSCEPRWTCSPCTSRPARAALSIVSMASAGGSPNFDPRRHPHEHALDLRAQGPRGLLERVEDDEPDADLRGAAKLLVRLVVAVHDDARGGHPRVEGELELAERGHVRPQPLLREQPQEG